MLQYDFGRNKGSNSLFLPAMDTEPWFSSIVAVAAARHAVAGVCPSPCVQSTSRPSPARLSTPLQKYLAPPALFLSLLSFSSSSVREQSRAMVAARPPHDEPPSELAPTSTNPPGALTTSYGTSPNYQTTAPATSLPEQNPPPPPRPPARRAPFLGSPPPKPTLGMGRSRLADAHQPTHRRPPSPEHRCTPRRAPPLTAPAVGASPVAPNPNQAHLQVR